MFKVILKQPWAEMASAGLMTVVHVDAPHEEVPKRIFVQVNELSQFILKLSKLYPYRL